MVAPPSGPVAIAIERAAASWLSSAMTAPQTIARRGHGDRDQRASSIPQEFSQAIGRSRGGLTTKIYALLNLRSPLCGLRTAARASAWLTGPGNYTTHGRPHLRCFVRCRFFRRTPGPPPFSSMNSTPAVSNARLMTSRVARRGWLTRPPAGAPSRPRPLLCSARSCWLQASRAAGCSTIALV